ncbi:MAG TPA: helix-turn-helix transcriptional regulator [Bacilli bacterium]|nr:helix-turn-helix transcriptional regulator [Bacilli bacterium]
MGTLNAPSHTAVHHIPLGRRIREIMEEKGDAYTVTALAIRMKLSRHTVSRMLKDKRLLFNYELENISNALGVSVDRILQTDVQELVEELDSLIYHLYDLQRAKKLAEKFQSLAIGATEKCEANIRMGKLYHELQQYEIAHEFRAEAHRLAKVVKKSFNDSGQFDRTIRHMVTSCTVRKDYTNAYQLIDEAKGLIRDDPKRLGGIYYSLAMIAYENGRLHEARDQLYRSLDSFRKSEDVHEIGSALHNVAYIEYKMGEFEKSKALFEESIATAEDFPLDRIFAIKDYAKVLDKLGHTETAIQLLENQMELINKMQMPDLYAKMILLHSTFTGGIEGAVEIVESEAVADQHRLIACKLLMRHYRLLNDSESLMSYYIKAEELTAGNTNRYGEEDL